MKRLRILVLPALMLVSIHAMAEDSQEERTAAARRYLDAARMDKMTDDMVNGLAKGFPAEQRDEFLEFVRNAVRPEVLEQAAMTSMVKIFTADELNALADFYGSQVGKSAMGKFGEYMADVMPVIQQEMFRALQALPQQ